jgi:hypothetical protein
VRGTEIGKQEILYIFSWTQSLSSTKEKRGRFKSAEGERK